jgi:hypothetical protein
MHAAVADHPGGGAAAGGLAAAIRLECVAIAPPTLDGHDHGILGR